MTTLKLAAAVALTAILASTSFAQAGGFLPHQTVRSDGGQGSGNGNGFFPSQFNRGPLSGPANQGGPDNSKPAPEFGDSDVTVANGPTLRLSPDTMSCAYKGDHFVQSGTPEIWLKNLSEQTILKGSIITVTWPDGTKTSFEIPFDLKPGASVGIAGPAGSDQPGFHCSARVKVVYGPPQP